MLVMIVNDKEVSWENENLYKNNEIVIRPLEERYDAMEIDLTGRDVSLVVIRHNGTIGYFLGVYLRQTDGLSSHTEGIMGKEKLFIFQMEMKSRKMIPNVFLYGLFSNPSKVGWDVRCEKERFGGCWIINIT